MSDTNFVWEPWKNIILSVKTTTANITHLQRLVRQKNTNIKTEYIAEALDKRGRMEHTITIQMAPNGNFTSIEFGTSQIMEQFCSEPLSIQGLNVVSQYKKKINRKKDS